MTGSTRSSALIRIGVALVTLVEVGEAVHPRKHPLAAPLYLAVLAMALGIRARMACIALAVGVVLVTLFVDEHGPRDAYALAAACLLVATTPCGHSMSFDRWRRKCDETGNVLGLRLLGAGFTLLVLWNAYNEVAHHHTAGLVGAAAFVIPAAATWVPKVRVYAVGALIVALQLARLYANLPGLDVLLLAVLSLAQLAPETVHTAIDDMIAAPTPAE